MHSSSLQLGMSIEPYCDKNMNVLEHYPLIELKRAYLILHDRLRDDPELMDSQLLADLQAELQHQAKLEGIDVTHHAHWAEWLQRGS